MSAIAPAAAPKALAVAAPARTEVTSRCGIIFDDHGRIPHDSKGCLLALGHEGPHEFCDARGARYAWENDLGCGCEDCQSDDSYDWCILYWPVGRSADAGSQGTSAAA